MDDTGDKGKHDCKGQNSCKGQGGCKAGDNGCKGQNSCKGKGGCNTNKPQRVVSDRRLIREGAAGSRPRLSSLNMPANRFNGFTDYGIGIGLRVPHYQHILSRKPVVDWFEIISENFMVDGGRPLEVLDQILEQYRVVQHGVSMYFGSADKPEPRAPEAAQDAWSSGRRRPGSPTIFAGAASTAATRTICCRCPTRSPRRSVTAQKIREVRDFLEVPICVENVSSYAEFHASEMTEWEFLSEVVELADCGILLDVNNIYVSSKNHDFDPYDYVNNVPHDRVGQIHIAGHSKFEKYILDTHDHPVLDPVWKLYARATKLCGIDRHAAGVGRQDPVVRRGPS